MTEDTTIKADPETGYRHWPRVYAAVLIVTAAVITALAIFSEIFS